jgi:rhodanese-related sulfurtransferase
MNRFISVFLLAIGILVITSCSNAQSGQATTDLKATIFAEKIRSLPGATIIDVRTPGEYSAGHLQNALNYNWNGDDFDKQIASLDKTKPVFVYCHSGRRSNAAAKKMRANGFAEVYELKGGIVKWEANDLPVVTGK